MSPRHRRGSWAGWATARLLSLDDQRRNRNGIRNRTVEGRHRLPAILIDANGARDDKSREGTLVVVSVALTELTLWPRPTRPLSLKRAPPIERLLRRQGTTSPRGWC